VKQNLQNHGYKVIFSARFMPGVRSQVFLSSGALGIPFRVFLLFDGLAAMISVPAIVYSCYFFGDQINNAVGVIKNVEQAMLRCIRTRGIGMLPRIKTTSCAVEMVGCAAIVGVLKMMERR
jgi:membrane protein DedA with SNARE-associated domain